METYFDPFGPSLHRGRALLPPRNCSAWAGHNFRQIGRTSKAMCPTCGDQIDLAIESYPDTCYNFYGHKFKFTTPRSSVDGCYCTVCGLTMPTEED